MPRTTIDVLLAQARSQLERVTVQTMAGAVRDGALVVDIRSEFQRAADGLIPGAIFHPRNVLEWRCDPASGHDDPRLSGDLGRQIILVCNEGYQSSLAAATLQTLGFSRATDLAGGFQAWAAAGMPVEPGAGVHEAAGGYGVLVNENAKPVPEPGEAGREDGEVHYYDVDETRVGDSEPAQPPQDEDAGDRPEP